MTTRDLLGLLILGGIGFLILPKLIQNGNGNGGIMPRSKNGILEKMAMAIMEFEGFWEGSVSWRNNNPGNLKAVGQQGVIGKDPQGHAIFSSFDAGWNALINQLRIAFEGRSRVYTPEDTLYSFFAKYAEANSKPYAEFVANRMAVSPAQKLRDIAVEV